MVDPPHTLGQITHWDKSHTATTSKLNV